MKLFILSLFVALAGHSVAQSVEQAKKLFEAKKTEESRKILITIDDDHADYATAQFYLGRIAFDQKNYEDALSFFEEVVDHNENSADYQEWLGNAMGNVAKDANLFRQGLLAPKMKAAWERAIELDPKRTGPRFSLIEYYTQAPGFMGGSMENAEKTAREIIALSPAEGHRALGNVYAQQKKNNDAEKEFLEAVRLNPGYTTALANFYVSQNMLDKAFGLFDDALKKNPDDMLASYQLGRTAAISGQRLDQGEACLKRYLTYQPKLNEPSHAGAQMRWGQIQEKRGNKVEAKKLYEAALQKDASLKEAKEGLERVSK
jgi:tetratricopeptide (TPR) repeat protein